jgi:hypothetical protein
MKQLIRLTCEGEHPFLECSALAWVVGDCALASPVLAQVLVRSDAELCEEVRYYSEECTLEEAKAMTSSAL